MCERERKRERERERERGEGEPLNPMKSSHFLSRLQEDLVQEVDWVREFSLQLKIGPPGVVVIHTH